VTLGDRRTTPPLDIRRLVDRLIQDSGGQAGPVAIQAGHFMLLPAQGSCIPSVETGRDGDPALDSLRYALSQFSLGTWRAGVAFLAELRHRGQEAHLLTLVNDWQYLRNRTTPDAHRLRSSFYADNRNLFTSYSAILAEVGLDDSVVAPVAQWHPFISEYWLRRRIERRLKRMVKQNGGSGKLSIQRDTLGGTSVILDDFGRACRLLLCGQADCAGEVMELIHILHSSSYRCLINIVPTECELPVNEGTRRALVTFELDDFSALNITTPCISFCSVADRTRPFRAVHVRGERLDCGRVDAYAEPLGLHDDLLSGVFGPCPHTQAAIAASS